MDDKPVVGPVPCWINEFVHQIRCGRGFWVTWCENKTLHSLYNNDKPSI